MLTATLQTKLYTPQPRPGFIPRTHLIDKLNGNWHCKLTLVSAPAGFGKTTLISSWIADCHQPVAWLSLDEGDSDPIRFLTYLIAALQTLPIGTDIAKIGKGVLGWLQSPQPPPTESILTALINEIATIPNNFILVLDDYHVLDTKAIDDALSFLLEHLPPQMHLVIATREDPQLPLARYRARGQMTELRATDLRFTPTEAAAFLNQMMGLALSPDEIAALETRTEGWIAGLQLAALSMQGSKNSADFIQSFTGSHRFVLDYLVEEVLLRQPEHVQTFLLRTSICERFCGPLCDVLLDVPSASSQETLAYIEQANLFIIPLDNERRWYRYHHLFADLLRQRLSQIVSTCQGTRADETIDLSVEELHYRASIWHEENGLELEAFHHAVMANDITRAAYLIEGKGMPLHFRGATTPVLNWLKSLPTSVLDAEPSLWITYASALAFIGQNTGVEEKLQAAEAALHSLAFAVEPASGPDDQIQDLVGRIAAIRAMLAMAHNQCETTIAQSQRALTHLHPDNLSFRTNTTFMLGYAYQIQGNRTEASQAYTKVIPISEASGNIMVTIAATSGLGTLQIAENQLHLAFETFQRVLQVASDPPQPVTCAAHVGLAHILYEWNDLEAAQRHGQQSTQLSQQMETVDMTVDYEMLLARLKLARGDVSGTATHLTKAEQTARQHHFMNDRMPEVAAVQVLMLLHRGDLATAARLAHTYELPLSQARVCLAQGKAYQALVALRSFRQEMEARGWADEQLKVMVLQAVALHAHGENETALQVLANALAMAEPGGFMRLFVDEGRPMLQLLTEAATNGIMSSYVGKLLTGFDAEEPTRRSADEPPLPTTLSSLSLVEPLSPREQEVLHLLAQGLTNREIGERLFLALDTVKGHNRRIFGKLQVQRRTEAVVRAHELGLL